MYYHYQPMGLKDDFGLRHLFLILHPGLGRTGRTGVGEMIAVSPPVHRTCRSNNGSDVHRDGTGRRLTAGTEDVKLQVLFWMKFL